MPQAFSFFSRAGPIPLMSLRSSGSTGAGLAGILTKAGLEKIGEASPGGAGRSRTLGLNKLMAIQVPTPSPAMQRTFDTLQTKVAELKATHATIRQSNDALIPATLERLFAGAD